MFAAFSAVLFHINKLILNVLNKNIIVKITLGNLMPDCHWLLFLNYSEFLAFEFSSKLDANVTFSDDSAPENA